MSLTVLVFRDDGPEGEPPRALCFDALPLRIGRGEACEIRLPDASVSQHHATLHRSGTTCEIVDEGSTNGTFLARLRLPAHERRPVSHGSSLQIGPWRLELRTDPSSTPAEPLSTRELTLALVNDALAAHGQAGEPRVFVRAGPDEGKVIPLPDEGKQLVLGRGLEADVLLDEPKASRWHLRLSRRGGELCVCDLASRQGTQLSGVPLRRAVTVAWPVGDELRLGDDIFVYEDPALAALAHLEKQADQVIEKHAAEHAANYPEPPPMEPIAAGEPVAPVAPLPDPPPPAPRPAKRPRWGVQDVVVGTVVLLLLLMILVIVWWLVRIELETLAIKGI